MKIKPKYKKIIINTIIKYLTFNKYYLCEECKSILKKDGTEIILNGKHNLNVCKVCCSRVISESRSILNKGIMEKYKNRI